MEQFISGDNISYILVLVGLGLIPVIFMSCTSYLKISIVLSVLRNALGGGQLPSQAMSGVITLVLSIYTMTPIFSECIARLEGSKFNKSNLKSTGVIEKVSFVSAPLVEFMRLNTPFKERVYFLNLHRKKFGTLSVETECNHGDSQAFQVCIDEKENLPSLLLSFLASELKLGCLIGVYLFLPFLAVDLIVSTILTALGMMMVSPVTISLPIKLMLFVLSDGWRLLMENLVLSYTFT